MSFIYKGGRIKEKWLPVTASTALPKDSLVTYTSGLLVAATAGTASADIIGVLNKAIASTDTDYATSGRLVPVIVPTERFTLWEADVTSGLVAADVLKEVDLTDNVTVNRGAGSVKAVRAISVISALKGIFWVKFQGSY